MADEYKDGISTETTLSGIESEIKIKSPKDYLAGESFPIAELVRKQLSSPQELEKTLLELPFKNEPNTRLLNRGSKDIEFVDLEKIVGSATGNSWLIYDGNDSRDPEYTLKLLKGLIKGEIKLFGENNNEPILLDEFQDEFFVSGDGRHRIAVLKASNVPFIPASVTHFS